MRQTDRVAIGSREKRGLRLVVFVADDAGHNVSNDVYVVPARCEKLLRPAYMAGTLTVADVQALGVAMAWVRRYTH
jgi:hypothetical protein